MALTIGVELSNSKNTVNKEALTNRCIENENSQGILELQLFFYSIQFRFVELFTE